MWTVRLKCFSSDAFKIAPGTPYFSKAAEAVDIAERLKTFPICVAALKSSVGFDKVGCTRAWDEGVGVAPLQRKLAPLHPPNVRARDVGVLNRRVTSSKCTYLVTVTV